MIRSLALVTLALGCLPSLAAAQEAILLELYGRGVHAYFAGNNQQAIQHLSSAINAGSLDPRAFYYRGLASQRQYGSHAGQSDFQRAAELEVADAGDFYAVGRALERIQGNRRLEIERFRTQARLDALQRQRRLQRERYEELDRVEPEVTIPIRPEPGIPAPIVPPAPVDDELEMEFPLDDDEPSVIPPAPTDLPDDDPFGVPFEDPDDMPLPDDEPPVPFDEPDDPFGVDPADEMEFPDAPDADLPPGDDFPMDDLPPDDFPADDFPANDFPADDLPMDDLPPADDDPFGDFDPN